MKNLVLTVIFLFAALLRGNAQDASVNNIPLEELYVHSNAGILFSGEYLYYKIYCFNAEIHTASKRSEIAYVELIDINKNAVFKHKIILKDGLGDGDFFVPSTIPSGNYTLIAYTQWMQNNVSNKYFDTSIKIINPYIAEIYSTPTIALIKNVSAINTNNQNTSQPKNLNFNIKLNTPKLQTRSPLNITVQNNMGAQGNGAYSISVRKVDEIFGASRVTATNSMSQNLDAKKINPREATHKAETDGYLLTGTVIIKTTQLPAKSIDVAISIPGKDFFFSVVTTNALGNFSFEIDPDFPGEQAIIQVVESNKTDYSIKLNPKKSPDYSKLEFPKFSLKESEKEKIVARSIYNQIENGYYDLKPDTVVEKLPATSFVRYETGVTYKLEDYTRFKTMKEVFTEIVRLAWTTKQNGTRIVKVLEREMSTPTPYLPLLFIDGMYIESHEEFLALNALEVQTIKVIRKGYFFGNKEYQGVIVVKTKKGDYTLGENIEAIVEVPLFLPQQSKRFFSQSYTTAKAEATKRIPDYRLQLLWNPTLTLTTRERSSIVYTSDIPGVYEVVLEGFTNQGVPVSLTKQFEVIDAKTNSN